MIFAFLVPLIVERSSFIGLANCLADPLPISIGVLLDSQFKPSFHEIMSANNCIKFVLLLWTTAALLVLGAPPWPSLRQRPHHIDSTARHHQAVKGSWTLSRTSTLQKNMAPIEIELTSDMAENLRRHKSAYFRAFVGSDRYKFSFDVGMCFCEEVRHLGEV